MFRHVVMFRWAEATGAEQREAAERELRAFAAGHGDLGRLTVGHDAGLAEGNWDLVVVCDFADRAGYERYRDHPDHLALVREWIAPSIAARAAVQCELAG